MSSNRKAAKGKGTLAREIKILGCFSYRGNSTKRGHIIQKVAAGIYRTNIEE
jgi:hypothetical protein